MSVGNSNIRGRRIERMSKNPVQYTLSSPRDVVEEGWSMTYLEILIIIRLINNFG